MGEHGLDSSASGKAQVATSFKHGNVASISEECGELLDLETVSLSRRFLPHGFS